MIFRGFFFFCDKHFLYYTFDFRGLPDTQRLFMCVFLKLAEEALDAFKQHPAYRNVSSNLFNRFVHGQCMMHTLEPERVVLMGVAVACRCCRPT